MDAKDAEKHDEILATHQEDPIHATVSKPPTEKVGVLAQRATEQEHALTVREAIQRYPQAVLWSILVSTCIIMEGYDIVLISSFFAQTAFSRKYGDFIPSTNSYQLSAPWQAGLSNGTAIGTILWRVRQWVLLIGQIFYGIPWGVFATTAPAYASEICPMALRGYLTVYVNICWAIGQLIAAGVQSGFSSNTTQWAYRIPFAV